MGHRERTCRECSERYTPTRFDQVHCRTCSDRLRDVHLIHDTLFSSPNQSVDRVAIATGLSIERIRDLAAEGALRAVPVGADMPTECVCPPGTERRGRDCVRPLACSPPMIANAAGTECVCPPGTERRGRDCVRPLACSPPTMIATTTPIISVVTTDRFITDQAFCAIATG